MKKRLRKKRKKQVHLEGLERGNRYLKNLTERLLQERVAIQKGTGQIIDLYHSLLTAICVNCGGSLEIDKGKAAELRDRYELDARSDADRIVLKLKEREQV